MPEQVLWFPPPGQPEPTRVQSARQAFALLPVGYPPVQTLMLVGRPGVQVLLLQSAGLREQAVPLIPSGACKAAPAIPDRRCTLHPRIGGTYRHYWFLLPWLS